MLSKNKSTAKLEFEKGWEEMNKKHHYNESDAKITLDKKETKKRYDDLLLERESDELEFTQDKLIDDKDFTVSKFNKIFDIYKKTLIHT